MNNWANYANKLQIISVLLLIATTPVQAQSITEVQSTPQPNKVFAVQRKGGNCPQTVGFWAISLGYRNIAAQSETLVIADTLAIASGSAKLVSSRTRFVEYQAPVQKAYASCVGMAISPKNTSELDASYKFRFQNGKVYFSVDLTNTSEGFGAGVIEHKIIGLRPYVLWQFID